MAEVVVCCSSTADDDDAMAQTQELTTASFLPLVHLLGASFLSLSAFIP